MTNEFHITNILNRNVTVHYSDEAKSLLRGKTVMVTGGGGSIGSELVKQLNQLNVDKVIIIDRDEYALYKLELETKGSALLTDSKLILADIQNFESISKLIAQWQPSIVFHSAAVKHLPLLERSPDIAILTNVMGTENVIKACVENNVERVVNISTDKAASPISVLGKSKRLAEIIAREYSDNGTMIASVRFGNVFASRGSFIETLKWQVHNDKPITLTDSETTRFFMTIPQAASLVIEAAVLASSGHTYVLDMGEPVKIADVISKYLHMTGKNDAMILKSGLRKGEKKHERLFDTAEKSECTSHPSISSVTVDSNDPDILSKAHVLYRKITSGTYNNEELKSDINSLLLNAKG